MSNRPPGVRTGGGVDRVRSVLLFVTLPLAVLTYGGPRVAARVAPPANERACQAGDSVRIRVAFDRTGGVAGTHLRLSLDSDTLTRPRARQLRRLITAARFFELPAVIADSAPAPDRFQYRISVRCSDRRHSVRVAEAAIPQSLQPLVEWLERVASESRWSDHL